MENTPSSYKWPSFENIYNSIKEITKNESPLIGNFTHKIDGSNFSMSITNNSGSKSIKALYGRKKIIWEKSTTMEDIPEIGLYGNACRINNVLQPGFLFSSILCDIVSDHKEIIINELTVYFEIYKKNKKNDYNCEKSEFMLETLHPFGYKINNEIPIMLNMETSNYFNQVSKIMYGEGSVLSNGFSSFSDLHEYLRTLTENVVIVPKILFYGELTDGVITLAPQLINVPENLKNDFEGFFWVNDDKFSKISGLKFKSCVFSEQKVPIPIQESYSEKIINLIKISNEIRFSGSVSDIGNLFGDTIVPSIVRSVSNFKNKRVHNEIPEKELKLSSNEKVISEKKTVLGKSNTLEGEIYNNVDKAIEHEITILPIDEFLVLDKKLKYIFSLLHNTNNDNIPQDIKIPIDELIISIKTEFAKGYIDNELEVPQIDINHYIYTKLNVKYMELKKSLPKKKK